MTATTDYYYDLARAMAAHWAAGELSYERQAVAATSVLVELVCQAMEAEDASRGIPTHPATQSAAEEEVARWASGKASRLVDAVFAARMRES